MFDTKKAALVIIDVQKAIDSYSNEERNNLDAEEKIGSLINSWRDSKMPIIHVRHASKLPASPYHSSSQGFTFKPQVKPLENEIVVTKQENCAFIGTHLDKTLKELGIIEIVVCGVLVNNSVDATVRVASGLGYKVNLVHDASATFALKTIDGRFFSSNDVHWLFLSNLHEEYCIVCSTKQVLENLQLRAARANEDD